MIKQVSAFIYLFKAAQPFQAQNYYKKLNIKKKKKMKKKLIKVIYTLKCLLQLIS